MALPPASKGPAGSPSPTDSQRPAIERDPDSGQEPPNGRARRKAGPGQLPSQPLDPVPPAASPTTDPAAPPAAAPASPGGPAAAGGRDAPGPPAAPAVPTPPAAPAPPASVPRSVNAVNAIIHLHRAEVGRLTAYRVRLDTTTSWAITSSALVTTFAFGDPQVPHPAFLFLMFINYFFLQLEARRFRAYESSRHRVQVIERSFYREMLSDQPHDPGWTNQLVEAVEDPWITVNPLGAIGWRLRRNYLWIYAGVLITWIGKLYITPGPPESLLELVPRAAIGPVPGWLVWALVLLVYAALTALAFGARRTYPLGDDDLRRMLNEPPS